MADSKSFNIDTFASIRETSSQGCATQDNMVVG